MLGTCPRLRTVVEADGQGKRLRPKEVGSRQPNEAMAKVLIQEQVRWSVTTQTRYKRRHKRCSRHIPRVCFTEHVELETRMYTSLSLVMIV